jgi:hypothetical protein
MPSVKSILYRKNPDIPYKKQRGHHIRKRDKPYCKAIKIRKSLCAIYDYLNLP